jgi:hypothetical protein
MAAASALNPMKKTSTTGSNSPSPPSPPMMPSIAMVTAKSVGKISPAMANDLIC